MQWLREFEKHATQLDKQGKLDNYEIVQKQGTFVLKEISGFQRLWRSLFGHDNTQHINNIKAIAEVTQRAMSTLPKGGVNDLVVNKLIHELCIMSGNVAPSTAKNEADNVIGKMIAQIVHDVPEFKVMKALEVASGGLEVFHSPLLKVLEKLESDTDQYAGGMPDDTYILGRTFSDERDKLSQLIASSIEHSKAEKEKTISTNPTERELDNIKEERDIQQKLQALCKKGVLSSRILHMEE